MDQNMEKVLQLRIESTIKALRANRFDAHYLPDKQALEAKLSELLPAGSSCSVGGSVTLFESGVVDFIKRGDYTYYDRYDPALDQEEVFHQALSCDVYFTGTNAITEDGRLLNVDGRGNRVAAIAYGPNRVVVVSGWNKIARDLEAARNRVRDWGGPANAIRLGIPTPCTKTGKCMDCRVPQRICCHELVSGYQRVENRITVLILGGEYGY